MKATDQDSAVETVTTLFAEYQTDYRQIFLDAINNLREVVEANILKSTEQQERRRSTEQRVHAVAEQFTETGSIRYYYAPGSNSFVSCDGAHYTMVREDDVIAAVLRVLQTDSVLCKSKQKSRHAVMKLIKANLLTDCIPDSETIKSVVDLLRSLLLPTKNDAKYLLTIIGDIILKKASNLTFLVNQAAIKHIEVLSDIVASDIGHRDTIIKHFVVAYARQAFRYRVVRTKSGIPETLMSLKGQAYNICAVACHYSNQYGSSDNYIIEYSTSDPALSAAAFSPKEFTLSRATEMFIADCTITAGTSVDTFPNGVCTTNDKVHVAWSIWCRKTNFFLNCSWTEVRSLLPHSDQDTCDIALQDGEYIDAAFKFCQDTLIPDNTETLLELTELFALFVEVTDCQHNENIFQEVATTAVSSLGGAIDGAFIHGLRTIAWDKHGEVMNFLEGAHSISGSNVLASYRAYARATPGKKVSRAYFTHKLSETAAF